MGKFIFLKSLHELLIPLKRLIDTKADKDIVNKKAEKIDWDEKDSKSLSYIKNKPFYSNTRTAIIEIFPTAYFTDDNAPSSQGGQIDLKEPLKANQTYQVLWNNVSYKCIGREYNGYIMIGNNAIYEYDNGIATDTGEPFAIEAYNNSSKAYVYYYEEQIPFSLCIGYEGIEKYAEKKLDAIYLPDAESYLPENIIRPDYNIYDETQSGYIKNRPCYYDEFDFNIEESISCSSSQVYYKHTPYDKDFIPGATYQVTGEIGIIHSSQRYTLPLNFTAQGVKSGVYYDLGGLDFYQKLYIPNNSSSYYLIINGLTNGSQEYKGDTSFKGRLHGYLSYYANRYGTSIEFIHINAICLKQLDEHVIPNTIAKKTYVDEKIAGISTPDVSGQIEAAVASLVDSAPETLNTLKELSNALGDDPNFATTVTTQLGNLEKQIHEPKDGIVLIDQVNGYHYIGCMRDGNFVTYCATQSIEITKMPDKSEYYVGDAFDPTGMIITAKTYDGSLREITNYSYSENIPNGVTSIEIIYYEAGNKYVVEVPIILKTMTELLQDFEYTDNSDGTYTLTAWKGTLNGEPSTEIVIPDNKNIIL